jgi:hypothetical protein
MNPDIDKIIELMREKGTRGLGVAMMVHLNDDDLLAVMLGMDISNGTLVKLLSISFFEKKQWCVEGDLYMHNDLSTEVWFTNPKRLNEMFRFGFLLRKKIPTCPLGHLNSHLISLIAEIGTIEYENQGL